MTKEEWAFNEWLRQYIEDPEGFCNDMANVKEFLQETKSGEIPSYGESCNAFFEKLINKAPEREKDRISDFEGYDPEWN